MQSRMTHICLHVDNLKDSVLFYRRYCQMKIIADCTTEGEGSIYLSETGKEAELVFQFKSGGKSLTLTDNEETHFGFVVDSRKAVDEVATMAREDGTLFWEPDEYLQGAYICAVRDPNGNCVEFSYGHPVPPN